MSAKQQGKSTISPVLFITVEGEPMYFFLRPGAVKRKLQPLITAGGGMLCNVQQPGAILLIDPSEKGCIAETTAHWYVSTQYIHDCIEKDEQLNLEDYKFNPEVVKRQSARLGNNKSTSPKLSGSRAPYSAEDDAAILSYISNHKREVGGNRLWQEMEKQRVTSHSWQSMKYRYRMRLATRGSDVVEVATTKEDEGAAEGENKVEGDQEKKDENDEKTCSEEDATSPQIESDLTQLDAEDIPAEISKAETTTCPPIEVKPESPQTDNQLAESTDVDHVEAEISISIQSEEPYLEPPADARLIPSESTEPKSDEPPMAPSPQRKSMPNESPPEPPKSLTETSSQKQKPKEKRKTSPTPEEPQRRSTRRQLQLKESPEPYGKRLRSSLGSIEQPSPPKHLKEPKSAVKSTFPKETADEPPPKKSRGKTVRDTEESQQEEGERAAVSDQSQADNESRSKSRKEGKKKGKKKKKLGILEMAAKEFESESEPEEVNTPDLESSTETVTKKPIETEPAPPSQDTPTAQSSPEPETEPEPGPSLHQDIPDTGASTSNCLPMTGCPEPAASEVVDAAAKPHLFIFDSESQKEDSQFTVEDSEAPANQQPTVNQDPFSLTQVQLEENKQQITALMKQTNKDLVTVTKALLKTSGDFSDALDLLSNPSSFSTRVWRCSDDDLLLSGDLAVRQQLQERYGEKLVAKRIVFLELDGCN